MNKEGFTLAELLAVIVILSLLGLLVSNSITKIVKDSKDELYSTQIELIKSAAETWGADNLDLIPEDGKCAFITLGNLKQYGLLESNIINPRTNKEFPDNMKIKVSSFENNLGLLNINYEVEPQNLTNCYSVYPNLLEDYSNDEVYPWSFNNGIFKSTNHEHNTTSNITFNFVLVYSHTLKFDWSVSSENVSYDYVYYTIKKDGVVLSDTGSSTKIGGINYGTTEESLKYLSVSKILEPGEYELIFSYRKDGSVSSGTDTAYIKNIVLKKN